MKNKNIIDGEGFAPKIFTIESDGVEKLNTWMGHIYKIYGKYGEFEYRFKESGGFGFVPYVYSHLTKTEICLDVDVNY